MQKRSQIVFSLLMVTGMIIVGCGGAGTKQNVTDSISTTITTTTTNTPPPQTASKPRDSASMMKAWQVYMTPGDMQKLLASFEGTWNEEITAWHEPGAPAKKNTATGVSKMILGGRYLQTMHKGSYESMPFEGIETLGYDNTLKMFQSSWVDNMGSGIMNMRGTWDAATKTIEFKGKSVDPLEGKEIDTRNVIKIIDDKTHVVEMYMAQNGSEFKTMEIKCTKK